MDEDYQLALLLQNEFNNESGPEIIQEPFKGKAVQKRNNDSKTQSLVDPQWEFIDPTPDIHVLFLQFNDRFFWGKLHTVEVKWSSRMTSCAGVCVYQGRSGFCSVRLSLPLLKLRPRKDLVETLLHEMIHAYLFITHNNRDRDGHGPEFHKHMYRINGEAGTHISVYHSFHDEVKLYQQHWWRCNGPCQKRPPFFGTVRRSMNRAPGPTDNWWAQHQATCGGVFIKVREPENTKKKGSDSKAKPDKNNGVKGDIRSFFPGSSSKPVGTIGKGTIPSTSGSSKTNNVPKVPAPAPKDGFGGVPQGALFKKPTMANVHGFGGGDASSFKPTTNPAVNNVFGFGDLQSTGKKPPPGSAQPSGKGYTLGGSAKPPFQRGGGAFGGMLANKGGGTLVVSGTSNKFRDPPGTSSSSSTSVAGPSSAPKAFTGSGYVLGRGSQQTPVTSSSTVPGSLTKKPNLFQKSSVPSYVKKEDNSQLPAEPSKRLFPKSTEDSPVKKKWLDGDSSTPEPVRVSCPVCNKEVLKSVINAHLDACISDTPAEEESKTDVIVLSDSEDVEDTAMDHEPNSIKTESFVNCPSCDEKLLEIELDSHLSSCLSHSFNDEDDKEDGEDDVQVIPNSDAQVKCPICCESMPAAEVDKHLDNCASCSIQDLSNVFEEEMSDEEEDAAVGSPSQRVSDTGEKLYPCPCCLRMIETTKMNDHLDQCNFF